jgi:hypothetical protein
MKRWFYILNLLFATCIHAQKDSAKFGIGINFATMYSGTPELQLDYFFFRNIGISLNTGYTYKTVRGGAILVGDEGEIDRLRGAYVKFGVNFRSKPNKRKFPANWFSQLFFIRSFYDEWGRYHTDSSRVHLNGAVNGVATTLGFEWRLQFIELRAGVQTVFYYSQRSHLGYPGHTFQPGIGTSGIFDFPNQLILGLIYKFGKISD